MDQMTLVFVPAYWTIELHRTPLLLSTLTTGDTFALFLSHAVILENALPKVSYFVLLSSVLQNLVWAFQ